MSAPAALVCPECGARAIEGLSCWEQLCALLAWEFEDPELQAEHFLTVASYNLQHPTRFTDEAIAGLSEALVDRLDRAVSVQELRRRASVATEGAKRVLRGDAAEPVLRAWRVTIADVYIPEQPAGAAERVRRWAAAIRSEL